jgi:hypothetical protein
MDLHQLAGVVPFRNHPGQKSPWIKWATISLYGHLEDSVPFRATDAL